MRSKQLALGCHATGVERQLCRAGLSIGEYTGIHRYGLARQRAPRSRSACEVFGSEKNKQCKSHMQALADVRTRTMTQADACGSIAEVSQLDFGSAHAVKSAHRRALARRFLKPYALLKMEVYASSIASSAW